MKKLTQLFISILFIAGMSACNQQELDNLQSQIDELKSTQIASISSQISSIQASISSLEKMDTELKSRIEELSNKEEELEATDEAQAKEMASLRETLTQLETSLSKRIDDLKTYVDEELKEQKDWVSATFSTLEQYQSTCSEIASIKETLTNQETALKQLVSDTESSIKGWVNEQLTGYYTIAEMDAKISALEKTISDGDEAQDKELENLRADLETAKADIKAAYEKAISDAITEFEGKINEKIAADIKAATDALQGQIDEINTKIVDIEKRLGIIEESLEKILARVQSIVVVPNYINSMVLFKESEDTDILFEVSPRSASIALAQQDISVFSLDAVLTQTKASMFDVHFPIKSVKDNGECLVVTIDAANMDMEAIDKAEYLNSYSGRLKIDDGFNSMTTEYFTLVSDSDYTTYPLHSLRDYFESNLEEGQQNTISEGWRIKAEVISNSALNNVASSRLMFVQDYSAGIAIYCNAPHGYAFGDVLMIDLSNATITRYDGLLEVTNVSPDKIKKIGHKDTIEPKEVSIEDFLANKYESQYVAIKDVQVVNEDLNKTWVVNNTGTQIGIECSDGAEFVVFSRKNASYGAETVPQGSGIIKGVASRYNEVMQLFFAQNTDWADLNGTRYVVPVYEYYIFTETGTGPKASVSDSGIIVWGENDRVLLSDGNKSVICSIPAEYAGSTDATVKTKKKLEGEVLCIYPADVVTQEGSAFYVDVPEDQETDGRKYMVCSGSSSSNSISLSPRTALMKVKLSSDVEDLSSVRITFEGAPVVGRMQIDGNGASVISGTGSVKVAAHGDNEFYFSVLPASITKLDVDIVKTDGSFGRKTSSRSLTISEGRIYNLSLNTATISFVQRNWIELPEINTEGISAGTHGFFTRQMSSVQGVRNYSFLYSYGDYVSEWVAYPLNKSLIGSGSRTNSFGFDPLLPQNVQPNITTSYGGGYDRGHQIPSADRLNPAENPTTFYATNMTPQLSKFNSGIWNQVENQVRQWAHESDTTYVITGCVTKGGGLIWNTSGFNVRIPSAYYKAAIIYNRNTGYQGKAIILDHTAEVAQKTLSDDMFISIDALEEILGMDLFYCLPDVVGAQRAAEIEAGNLVESVM